MLLKNWLFTLSFIFALVTSGFASAQEHSVPRRIIVIGEGQISAAADKAVITLGARHSAKTAADAMAMTNETVTAILSKMAELGIRSEDIQTASLNLNPVWERDRRYDDGEIAAPIGFEATNQVRVTLRQLERLGVVLDQITQEGANSFSGFHFGLIDPAPLLDQARTKAISDARRKAELYAAAAGVALGGVVLITEETSSSSFQPQMMEMASARSAAVPIAQGEVTQTARIKVVFEIVE